jgi:hypothetical protein
VQDAKVAKDSASTLFDDESTIGGDHSNVSCFVLVLFVSLCDVSRCCTFLPLPCFLAETIL